MSRERPRLSVVIGSHNARHSIAECLETLLAQAGDETEIVVVDNSTDGTAEIIRRRFPGTRLLPASPTALIPELWAAGLREARGDIVAITTAHCVPAADWMGAMLKAHEAPVAAVGGAIESDGRARLVDWAVYFCRYSRYMLPFREADVPDMAGDNASYKRAHLEGCRQAWESGFWEPVVHAELTRAGQRLLLSPAPVVSHRRSFGFAAFVKQRFLHGIEFGRDRAAGFGIARRVLYVALCPAIPLAVLARVVRQVVAKGRHRGKLLAALPLLIPFLLAWGAGECAGYVLGKRA